LEIVARGVWPDQKGKKIAQCIINKFALRLRGLHRKEKKAKKKKGA